MFEYGEMCCICDECPMIWGLEVRIELSEKYGTEPQLEYCGCDKTGDGKFCIYGFCGDAFCARTAEKRTGKRQTGRAYRRYQAKQKDKRKRNIIDCGGYKPMIGYIEYDFVNGKWEQVGNHIKYPRNSNRQRYLKRQSNKKVRRHVGEIPNGNAYRKLFDYWWELY